jgi:hypothetical protein
MMTPQSEGADRPSQSRPTTFRLPKPGANDPYFGITRPAYYQGERDGWWTLIRLKRPGMKRGITLIPYDEVAAFIAKQRKQQNGGAQPAAHKSDYEEQLRRKEQQKHPTLGTL